jgi:hypothetical protein
MDLKPSPVMDDAAVSSTTVMFLTVVTHAWHNILHYNPFEYTGQCY